MSNYPSCIQCSSEYVYEDHGCYVCPECAHEWSVISVDKEDESTLIVKDANGNGLIEGDMVTVIKDLKVKGSSAVIKIGTKIKILRLVESDHNIDCRVDGIGQMGLKSEFVKKISS